MYDPGLAIFYVGVVFFYAFWAYQVGVVAETYYHRSRWGWTLLALFFSPITAGIFLAVAGVSHEAAIREQRQARILRRRPLGEEAEDLIAHERDCPHCGSPVNFYSREGLRVDESRPWVLICRDCHRELAPEHIPGI